MNNCKKFNHCCVDKGSPYLQITIDDPEEAPKVIFKGEKINLIEKIKILWETDTAYPGCMAVSIDHLKRYKSDEFITSSKIEERVKGTYQKT